MADIKLDNFKGLSFKIDMKQPIETYSNKCKEIVSQLSPKGKRGKYAKGWQVKLSELRNGDVLAEVWNATDWQLTHLLENGHIIANKKGGVGWASAKPHIEKAYQQVKAPFIEAMKNVVIK